MTAGRPPFVLAAYRAVMTGLTPLSPLLTAVRMSRKKEHPQRWRERRGRTDAARPAGSLVWIHCASVGELNAVLPLIAHICARGLHVLVTSGTVTSAELAETRLPAGALHQFVPFDFPLYVQRFFEHWRPDLAIFVESDLWPNMIGAAAARHIPLLLVNARMSQRSSRRWARAPATVAALFGQFDSVLAQSQGDGERFASLGARNVTTTGNLKLDVPALSADESEWAQLKSAISFRPVIAAASTHPGEENIVAAAHKRLRENFPRLLTIIVPRHPQRGGEVERLVYSEGLRVAVRSRGEVPTAETEIYLVDTLGDLGLVYRLAPIVYMGGSLVRHGGQNPIEAAKLGAATLHGPFVSNFTDIYAALDAAGGSAAVADENALTQGIADLLRDTASRKRMADAARIEVDKLGGAFARTAAALAPYLSRLPAERDADA
jgi:3-deoxy-D-manno-octulosonic-acid transferase